MVRPFTMTVYCVPLVRPVTIRGEDTFCSDRDPVIEVQLSSVIVGSGP